LLSGLENATLASLLSRADLERIEVALRLFVASDRLAQLGSAFFDMCETLRSELASAGASRARPSARRAP